MDYDDDLWGPPSYVEEDTFPNQTLPGCEFWFDPRTDVIEENCLNEKYCDQAWQILNNKQKPDAEFQKVSDSASASGARDPITTMTPSFEPGSKKQKMNETKESFNDTGLGSKICQETTTEEGENEISSLMLLAEEATREEERKDEWRETSPAAARGEQAWQKPDAVLQKDSDSASASVQNDMATSESDEADAIVPSHSVTTGFDLSFL